jgi:hypothetical protein
MEFLRFGSSIPGSYWGCCACDIIQNFKVDPDAKASIQMVAGDSGSACMNGSEIQFAGPTWRDIFWQRLRVGTFGTRDMPNHAFIAILTDWQINSNPGKLWLPILREAGFEFIRTVSNSVYAGAALGQPGEGISANYIFGLFRNIGGGAFKDPFTPPKAWTDLPKVKTEPYDYDEMVDGAIVGNTNKLTGLQHAEDTAIWNKIGPAKFLTEAEVAAAGAPVILAGQRSKFPQQPKTVRLALQTAEAAANGKPKPVGDPFATAVALALEEPDDFDECFDDYPLVDEDEDTPLEDAA